MNNDIHQSNENYSILYLRTFLQGFRKLPGQNSGTARVGKNKQKVHIT